MIKKKMNFFQRKDTTSIPWIEYFFEAYSVPFVLLPDSSPFEAVAHLPYEQNEYNFPNSHF